MLRVGAPLGRMARLTIARHTWPTSTAAFSSTSSEPNAPAFGGEVAELYSQLFEQNAPAWHAIGNAACGPGEPAAHLAAAFPNASVFGTDISEDMVAKASARATSKGLGNLTCHVVDAQCLKPYGDQSQDVVTMCYGLMFVPSLAETLTEMRRVLKPEGVLVVTVWKDMPYIDFVKHIMTEVFDGSPPPPPIDPLSLSKPAALNKPLAKAGLRIVEDTHGSYTFTTSTDPQVAWKMGVIPVWSVLQELQAAGEHGDVMGKAKAAFELVTAQFRGADGAVSYPPGTYRLVVAKPC